MAGRIARNDIDEVRSRVNIADVVGDYVTLKHAGVGSMKGLCPFHDERSPSFHVRPQVGRYHCFGCGEDGDVFSFIMAQDHTTFAEAVERMAAKIGFTLHYEEGDGPRTDYNTRARLIAANEAALEYFTGQLTTAAADPARRFLGERGFDPSAAQHFGVGFAPKSYDMLKDHLRGRGFTMEELVSAGLVSQGDRSPYDRFRGRLMWPIRDVTGATIGFGARRLLEDDKGPKYLNTPETPIYHKSQVLYGLDLARRDISKQKQVVIVEGYTDVMACHVAGVTTAVATCGTSFGVDHIKVLRPMLGDLAGADPNANGEVVFTFDPDEAGQRAASRAFAEEQRFAAQTYVAVAPGGLDPCDLRLARGDDAIRRLVTNKRPMFEFMIRRTLDGHDLETVEGRVGALRAAAPVLAGIRDRSLTQGYVRELAGWLGMEIPEVRRSVETARRRAGSAGQDDRSTGAGRDGRNGNGADGADTPDEPVAGIRSLPNDPISRMERDAVMAMVQQPTSVGAPMLGLAASATFSTPMLAAVRDAVVANVDVIGAGDWLDRLLADVPAPLRTLTHELALAPIPARNAEDLAAYCRSIVVALVERDLLARKASLLGQLQRADPHEQAERRAEIQRQLVDIDGQRMRLRADAEAS
ncbi:DNA primase [Curtobacterium flaccumfaciens]|uniref:DNA primase n=1 Tax=Curtobacterium flaccumfaciens TaxID=2035 RepID=UPI00188B79AF|nr:DNA primase [Curtobacterium flaccumfaciens]MBF4593574.1 DNA primase [Curtobacterium flaccumfaciens]MBO9047360.1 DNA primase [Curtobacterium flaccumfaciens pv. flaccumfaciens]MBO9050791.1 DNA primase [Curtobacterium flaccumfaciens pv. flaccumfaciens]MBO9057319.1 DNA primase [Curtobacterium flaccumfaciens pv. flaccumfaciens]MBT1672593.1 DNA primase [Curtobacterium flaccumfaciens pv. flaccumfaciens]